MYSPFPTSKIHTLREGVNSYGSKINEYDLSIVFMPPKCIHWMRNEYAKDCNKRAFGLRGFWNPEKLGSFLISTSQMNFISFFGKASIPWFSFLFTEIVKYAFCLKIMNHSTGDLKTDFGVWNRCDCYSSGMEILFQSFPSNMDFVLRNPSCFCAPWENFAEAK